MVLTDLIASNLPFTVGSIASSRPLVGGACSPAAPTTVNGSQSFTCALAGDLETFAPGNGVGRWILTMVVSATQTRTINNHADVTSTDVDLFPANNHADVAHQVIDVADLSITKTGPVTVTAGTGITYTIRITNAGPSLAENTKVFDRLPGGIQVISATAQGGSCTTGTPGSAMDRLMCGMGSIGVGETRVITVLATVRADVPPGTVLENDATVTSDIFDPNNANNFAFTVATVGNGLADLGVTKLGLGTFVAGEVATYIVTVTNAGPSWATDVSLHDQLPAQVTFLNAYVDFENGLGGVPLACGINQATNDLTCALGRVPVTGAEPIRVTINVRVKAETLAGTVLTNCADVRGDRLTDPNAANNIASVTNIVLAWQTL